MHSSSTPIPPSPTIAQAESAVTDDEEDYDDSREESWINEKYDEGQAADLEQRQSLDMDMTSTAPTPPTTRSEEAAAPASSLDTSSAAAHPPPTLTFVEPRSPTLPPPTPSDTVKEEVGTPPKPALEVNGQLVTLYSSMLQLNAD